VGAVGHDLVVSALGHVHDFFRNGRRAAIQDEAASGIMFQPNGSSLGRTNVLALPLFVTLLIFAA